MITSTPRRLLVALSLLVISACGSTTPAATLPPSPAPSGMAGMPGMADGEMPTGDGTTASVDGYTLTPASGTVPAGAAAPFTFRITGPDQHPVTRFVPEQTKLLHFYLVRTDLGGFQHLHPTMAADGTWTAGLAALTTGGYRAYTTFSTPDATGKQRAFVLSVPLTVPGVPSTTALASASPTATVDGYTLTLAGAPMAGMAHELTLHVAKDGKPVTDLEPYLDTYAHLSAFQQGSMAFAHLHPEGTVHGTGGGPDLTFHAEFSKPGNWRVYVQFQTNGTLHTAAFTVPVS